MKPQVTKLKAQANLNLKFGVLVLGWILGFGFWCFPYSALAARLYIDPATTHTQVGKEFQVSLKLDTEGEEANAVEVALSVDSKALAFRGAPDGGSVVSLWVERPHADANTIKLTGIMPGGFKGVLVPDEATLEAGTVTNLKFLAKAAGPSLVRIVSAKVIKNDGTGQALPISTADASVNVDFAEETSTSTPSGGAISVPDTAAPDAFAPVVIRSKYIQNGAWVLVFSTKGQESGIDHYEVSEGGGPFARAESPYLLKDQSRTVTISVKAIDYAGNERVETIPALLPADYSPFAIAGASLLIAVLLTWAIRRTLTRKRKRRR